MNPDEQRDYDRFVKRLPGAWLAAASLVLWVAFIAACVWVGQLLGATINIAWTPNPPEQNVIGYRVYRVLPEPRVLLVDTTSTTATVNVSDGDQLVLTAYSAEGESADSSPIIARLTPQEPYKKVVIQISSDLETWSDWTSSDIATREGNFFRLKIQEP